MAVQFLLLVASLLTEVHDQPDRDERCVRARRRWEAYWFKRCLPVLGPFAKLILGRLDCRVTPASFLLTFVELLGQRVKIVSLRGRGGAHAGRLAYKHAQPPTLRIMAEPG